MGCVMVSEVFRTVKPPLSVRDSSVIVPDMHFQSL
jgi:hypothetical protein